MRELFSFLAILTLFLGGCAKEGTVYDAPIDKVYEKLSGLDLGADIGSSVFRYYDSSPPVGSVSNESVTWHMGKPGKGTDVIAHLSDEGGGKTRVLIEVNTPDMGPMAALGGMARNMIRERIAAHIEDRPFDDQKFIDAMYGGNASLVPKEVRDQAGQALKMDAEMQRMRHDSDAAADNAPTPSAPSSVSRSDVLSGRPMIDTRTNR